MSDAASTPRKGFPKSVRFSVEQEEAIIAYARQRGLKEFVAIRELLGRGLETSCVWDPPPLLLTKQAQKTDDKAAK